MGWGTSGSILNKYAKSNHWSLFPLKWQLSVIYFGAERLPWNNCSCLLPAACSLFIGPTCPDGCLNTWGLEVMSTLNVNSGCGPALGWIPTSSPAGPPPHCCLSWRPHGVYQSQPDNNLPESCQGAHGYLHSGSWCQPQLCWGLTAFWGAAPWQPVPLPSCLSPDTHNWEFLYKFFRLIKLLIFFVPSNCAMEWKCQWALLPLMYMVDLPPPYEEQLSQALTTHRRLAQMRLPRLWLQLQGTLIKNAYYDPPLSHVPLQVKTMSFWALRILI